MATNRVGRSPNYQRSPTPLQFSLASVDDDAELRAVLRETAMEGSMRLSFQREPSFFQGLPADQIASQILIARTPSGELAAVGERHLRMAWVGGEPRCVAYLSGLRIRPPFRSGTVLARGYRFLRELDGDGRAAWSYTSVLEENHKARGLLEAGRAGMPAYRRVGRYVTLLFPISNRPRAGKVEATFPAEAQEWLNAHHKRHTFAPVERLQARGLASEKGRATLALREMPARQCVVAGYAPWLAAARPLVNGLAAAGWGASLPRAGSLVHLVYGTHLSWAPGGERHVYDLVRQALGVLAGSGCHFLVIGLDERSPALPHLSRLAARRLSSIIYTVDWKDSSRALPPEPLHLDASSL